MLACLLLAASLAEAYRDAPWWETAPTLPALSPSCDSYARKTFPARRVGDTVDPSITPRRSGRGRGEIIMDR
ncbi:MAG: hypothetical protein RQ760_17075, partial [Sedimentisphaerales bacterium]|nr:hypothetical protein [Sedimentisphaerales bacterium]